METTLAPPTKFFAFISVSPLEPIFIQIPMILPLIKTLICSTAFPQTSPRTPSETKKGSHNLLVLLEPNPWC